MEANTIKIGKGFLIHAMQVERFGHDEIMAIRRAMETGDWSEIQFTQDAYTAQWSDEDAE